MWIYWGWRIAVHLADGSMIRGVVAWSWLWGVLSLKDAVLLPDAPDGEPLEFAGKRLLLPRSRIVSIQVGVDGR